MVVALEKFTVVQCGDATLSFDANAAGMPDHLALHVLRRGSGSCGKAKEIRNARGLKRPGNSKDRDDDDDDDDDDSSKSPTKKQS